MSLLLPLDVKWPYAKDQHGFPVFGAAAISEDELKSVVVAVNNHERLAKMVERLTNECELHDVPAGIMEDARTLLATLEAEKGGEL